MTGVDPVKVTEYSVVFSAIALPLTYLPILFVDGRVINALGLAFLVLIVLASVAAIPLMIVTWAGA